MICSKHGLVYPCPGGFLASNEEAEISCIPEDPHCPICGRGLKTVEKKDDNGTS